MYIRFEQKGKTAMDGASNAEIKALIAGEIEKRKSKGVKQTPSSTDAPPPAPTSNSTSPLTSSEPAAETSANTAVKNPADAATNCNFPPDQGDNNELNDPVLPTVTPLLGKLCYLVELFL